ncbi:MAG: septum formation initiator family protein [Oscillospiraceae bacterium]
MPKDKVRAKKSKIIKFAIFAFVVYVVVSIIIMQMDISKRKEQLASVMQEQEEQSIVNEDLKNILNSGDEKEYIMRIAREKFGFVFPDERVFMDTTGE